MKKIAVACDHAGYILKQQLIAYLQDRFEVIDCGCHSTESVDYPDYALIACNKVKNQEVDFGILVCYTGIGMSIAANKVKTIRASLVGNVEDAKLTREHNNSNVLCLSAKNTPLELAKEIVDAYLESEFLGDRHRRRVDKISEIENGER